ncbi:MAG: hypothetical protein AAFY20_25675 [Cyanobacteria bacterium J06639_14]
MFEYLLRRYDAPPEETVETLELQQLAHEFRQEQAHREALEEYCDRYHAMAQQHQQDHAMMQKEPNLFALFWRKRRSSPKA